MNESQFPHESLLVYNKALAVFADIQGPVSDWSKQHAFVDHLSRASESILFNIAEAVRSRQHQSKLLTLDYSLGSVFECAACIDIAVLKGLLNSTVADGKKKSLLEVCKMLIGLRNSWAIPHVAEEKETYVAVSKSGTKGPVFHHETLDMYTIAIAFYRWLISTEPGKNLTSAFEKSTDALATRVVLNIAEGNGRYAELSRQNFLDTANAATAKLAVTLDMGASRCIWNASEIASGKHLLLRIGQMTAR